MTWLTNRTTGDPVQSLAGLRAAIAVVSAVTLLAARLPARRAAQVEPMTALRCD